MTENHSKATAESIAQDLGADWIFADEPTNGQDNDAGREAVRLQKVLSQAGVASRRHSEILIRDGRVQVNGKTITKQGVKVDLSQDVIHVDGARINVDEDKAYYVLNKPRGVQSTMSDEMGRRCVGDLVLGKLDAGERLFHVGRLDADTEGLLILTNDGELANRLMHPKYEVSKTYLAEVLGEAGPKLISTLREGWSWKMVWRKRISFASSIKTKDFRWYR